MDRPDAEPHSERPHVPTLNIPETVPAPMASEDVTSRLRRMSRRGFATAGASMLAGLALWQWLKTRAPEDGLIWPLRQVLSGNEAIAQALFRPDRLAPTFPKDRALIPRVNGIIGLGDVEGVMRPVDPESWRLQVIGGDGDGERRGLRLDDLKALPRVEQTTELKCIEGWSTVVHWTGARLADLAATTGLGSRAMRPYDRVRPPADLFEYVGISTPDEGYYVGLDKPSALHEQTLLCYEMNGEPLTPEHGAPLRLVIPVKYGIKNIKRIGTIRFTDRKPSDYWAELGYDWYAGH